MKRDNRVWIRMAAVLALGAGLCISTTAQPMQAAEDDNGVGQRLSRMAEQIEIMRVVLTNAINDGAYGEQFRSDVDRAQAAARKKLAEQLTRAEEAEPAEPAEAPPARIVGLADDEVTSIYNTVGLGGQYFNVGRHETFTSYTRGFYSAGTGVLFTTEVRAPVRQVEPDEQPEETTSDAEDEWTRARDEALGRRVTPGGTIWVNNRSRDEARKWQIDREYVDLAVDGVVEAIAKHGLRLDGLGDDESIIMAMRFSADRLGFTVPMVVTASDDDDEESGARASAVTLANVARLSSRVADLNVVVDVPKSLLLAYDAGRMSMDNLRAQVTVTSYSRDGGTSRLGVGDGSR